MSENRKFSNYFLLILLLAYAFIYKFIILNAGMEYPELITTIVIASLFAISVFFLGFSRTKLNPIKKKITAVITVVVVATMVITYILGIFVGMISNVYSLNTLFMVLTIIFTELFRYNMIRANKDDLIVVMLLTAFLSMIEIAINVPVWNTFDLELTFKVITSSVLPIIVQNIILSYLSYNIGYQPVFIYRIIKDILFYILPVIPNLGNYLTCMIGLCLPIVIYLYTSRRLEMYENGIKKKFNSSDFNVFDLIISVFIIVLIILISRAFPVYILGIGTESMTGAINKGDAVIVYKENQEENIRVGDVIVFEKSNKTIVHRVVEIENIDGVLHYSTQGDANNTKDNVDLIFENIEGKVKFKIPYIAYPSIWFSKLIGREI